MNRATPPPETREPEELERDIDRTRSSLGRTIDELESRLSPGQLIDQALSMGRRHGGEFAANLGRSVESNPLPLLLTAAGIAWMMMSSNEPRAGRRTGYGYSSSASEGDGRLEGVKGRVEGGMEAAKSAASAVGERTSRAGHAIGDTVSHTGERMRHAGEHARHAGERLREEGGRLGAAFANLLREQPLVAGAIGIAIGAAIGAALPRTEQEDRLLGETRDRAASRLKERASEAYDEAREHAAELLPTREGEQEERREPPGIGSEQAAATMPEAGTDLGLRRDH